MAERYNRIMTEIGENLLKFSQSGQLPKLYNLNLETKGDFQVTKVKGGITERNSLKQLVQNHLR